MNAPGILLLIPGPWKNHKEFVAAIAEANDGKMLAAGDMLFDTKKKRHANFELLPKDTDLPRAIFVGSGRSLDDDTKSKLDQHQSVACITVNSQGDKVQQSLAKFASAVRKAGGIAINVPRSGLSHDWKRWKSLIKGPTPQGLFQALVLQVPDTARDNVCSFGMSQFGLPDACVTSGAKSVESAWALFEFNMYLWQQRPVMKDGHTFSRNKPEAVKYKLKLVSDQRYPASESFHNSQGVWQMQPQ